MNRFLICAAAAAILATSPAAAQKSSYKLGPLWNVSRIDVKDGQYENYMDFLTKTWMDNQAYAKSQGWILDYFILDNLNNREGEPDILLVTRFGDYPSVAEIERRNELLNQRMNLTDHTADAASGQRGTMRTLMGNVMYRELQKR